MDTISEKEIKRLAELSGLTFDNEELKEIQTDLSRIADFMQVVETVNTDNVEPMIYPFCGMLDLREDAVQESLPGQDVLKNAPDSDSEYIVSPGVKE